MTKEEINKKLLDLYGKGYDGRPKFRIVYSNDEVEKRFGHFEVWYGSIFVNSFDGVREVPKYSYLQDVYVLEMQMTNDSPEILERITYEPIYVFPKDLPLRLDVAMIVCNHVLNPKKSPFEEKRKKIEVPGDSDLLWKLHTKEAILNPKGA